MAADGMTKPLAMEIMFRRWIAQIGHIVARTVKVGTVRRKRLPVLVFVLGATLMTNPGLSVFC
jgi:hypothetical protein